MKYTSVKNPVWANEQKTLINCEVNFDDLPEQFVEFTAVASGDYPHTHEIFSRCVAGNFGPVAEYSPRINMAAENKSEAQRRLAATDWVNQPDVYDPANTPHLTNRDAFLSYRSQVRVVTVNAVDGNLDWPQEPTASWA